jgi:hypothetical protein
MKGKSHPTPQRIDVVEAIVVALRRRRDVLNALGPKGQLVIHLNLTHPTEPVTIEVASFKLDAQANGRDAP